MENDIGYRHTTDWWNQPGNAKQAKNYTTANKQMAQTPAHNTTTHTHGMANAGGVNREVYFDLGGYYNLMDDKDYHTIERMIMNGTLSDTTLITPEQMGYGPRASPLT